MNGNPYKINDVVDSNTEIVEYSATEIIYYDEKLKKNVLYDKDKLKWNYVGEDILTLNEIEQQICKNEKIEGLPIIHVIYETGLWGVIYAKSGYSNWYIHGVTMGYA